MNHKIIFEVLPYSKTASEHYANRVTNKIVDAINELKNVDVLNVPEIVEENHIGLPYYRNIDARKFATLLREKSNKDIIINSVVVHHKSKDKFEQWLDESIDDCRIKNFVFVGAKIDSIKYQGPSVSEANLIAKNKKVNFGNIFIPDRKNEADRLVQKTASGCGFFTSQVLFEPDAVNVINEYLLKCKEANLKPAKFFLSFAPMSTLEDIAFVKWLGAKIDGKTELRLKNSQDLGQDSIGIIKEIASNILNNVNENADIGLNIEYITLHNLELARDLANILAKLKLAVKS